MITVLQILIDHRADVNLLMRSGKGTAMTPLDAALVSTKIYEHFIPTTIPTSQRRITYFFYVSCKINLSLFSPVMQLI